MILFQLHELKDYKKKKSQKKKKEKKRKIIRKNRMISAWSYVLVECFLYLKFLSISVTWRKKKKILLPLSVMLLNMYVRWYYANYAKKQNQKGEIIYPGT